MIGASVMLADPFTKQMAADRLVATMETGHFDIRPTAESWMIKARMGRKVTRSMEKN